MRRNSKGQFMSHKYPTAKLRKEVGEKLRDGVSDTGIAKWLMLRRDVKLYAAVKLIQEAKREIRQ